MLVEGMKHDETSSKTKDFLGTSRHLIFTRLKQLSYSPRKHRCLSAVLDFCAVKTITYHNKCILI